MALMNHPDTFKEIERLVKEGKITGVPEAYEKYKELFGHDPEIEDMIVIRSIVIIDPYKVEDEDPYYEYSSEYDDYYLSEDY